jgi:hypothetical protein
MPSALRLACNVARKVAVNDEGNLKVTVQHFELLPRCVPGMSKRNQKIPWKVCTRSENRISNPNNHSSATFRMNLMNQ